MTQIKTTYALHPKKMTKEYLFSTILPYLLHTTMLFVTT